MVPPDSPKLPTPSEQKVTARSPSSSEQEQISSRVLLEGLKEIAAERSKGKKWSLTIGVIVTWILIAWIACALLFGERNPEHHEGEPCGPGHHWTWVGIGPFSDLSCEPD